MSDLSYLLLEAVDNMSKSRFVLAAVKTQLFLIMKARTETIWSIVEGFWKWLVEAIEIRPRQEYLVVSVWIDAATTIGSYPLEGRWAGPRVGYGEYGFVHHRLREIEYGYWSILKLEIQLLWV